MKAVAFEQWCDRLQLPKATRDFLVHLRASPPARLVQGRLFNVSGTYASRKMGVSIQFESHTVSCRLTTSNEGLNHFMAAGNHFIVTLKHNSGRKSEKLSEMCCYKAKKTSGHDMLRTSDSWP
jgi:hypothetical protein